MRTTVDPNISLSKVWGSSSNDVYFVGNNGNIAHWDGKKWTRIESGTELNIGDIWGISDGSGGYNKYSVTENALLKLNVNNQLMSINVEPGMYLNSVWGINDNLIYTAGNGIVLYKNNNWEKINRTELNNVYSIEGNNFNNVFGISSDFSVIHFNGFNWQIIYEKDTNIYFSSDTKNSLLAAVGWQGDKAIITIFRNN